MMVLHSPEHDTILTRRQRQGKPQFRRSAEGDGLGEETAQTAFGDFHHVGVRFRSISESNHTGSIERDTQMATSFLFFHDGLIPWLPGSGLPGGLSTIHAAIRNDPHISGRNLSKYRMPSGGIDDSDRR
jgi:hypothetical protein